MDTNLRISMQEANEERFSRRSIDGFIRKEILDNPEMVAKIQQGVDFIKEYMGKQYYASKNARIAQLVNLDLPGLVLEIFVGVTYSQKPELFTSVTAQMAGRLKFSDKTDAIKTVAELMAVLCNTDAYDIHKENKFASLMVISRVPLSDKLKEYIDHSEVLPPMVCMPLELTSNFSSGYLHHNDSLILGKGNHHDGDLCLDVLNLVNRVALKLDTEFLSTVEEEPNTELLNPNQIEQWNTFKKQSYYFYSLMVNQGNEFHLTHKVDKRGRIYAQGYHITTQGTAFKKAMIELANEELVEGVPV